MTHSQHPEAHADAGDAKGMVSLQVTIRSEHAALLRGFAAREGATLEALASLWLEEKLDEALRSRNATRASTETSSDE